MHHVLASDSTGVAVDFVRAIASGDRDALLRLLAPDVELRALTPGRAWEIDAAEEAVETILGKWFGGERRIDSLDSVESELIGDLVRVHYRFHATTPGGSSVVEQQAYLTVANGAITALRLVCSGYRQASP